MGGGGKKLPPFKEGGGEAQNVLPSLEGGGGQKLSDPRFSDFVAPPPPPLPVINDQSLNSWKEM